MAKLVDLEIKNNGALFYHKKNKNSTIKLAPIGLMP